MVDTTKQYINSMVYTALLERGGYKLCAMYAMLLKGRSGNHYYAPFKNSNNKLTKGTRLISKKSGVSLTALNLNLNVLIEMGLCYHTTEGGFFMVGKKTINKLFKKDKRVPIQIGKNLRITTGNAMAVMIYSNGYGQTKQIDSKKTLGKAIRRSEKGLPVSHTQSRKIVKAHKKGLGLDNLNKVENIVLSNRGFVKTVDRLESANGTNDVSRGGYIRNMLESRGLLYSRRRYKTLWEKTISYEMYLKVKPHFEAEHGFVTYKNGRIKKPIVSEIMFPGVGWSTMHSSNSILSNYTQNSQKSTSLPKVSQNENRLSEKEQLNSEPKTSKKVYLYNGQIDFAGWLKANPEINRTNYTKYDR